VLHSYSDGFFYLFKGANAGKDPKRYSQWLSQVVLLHVNFCLYMSLDILSFSAFGPDYTDKMDPTSWSLEAAPGKDHSNVFEVPLPPFPS
jgi:hypothetical protein